jgi:enoyl-CoA hydratase/carnithine racemase
MTALPSPSTTPELSINDAVATLRINRPDKRNRLQTEDLHTLIAHGQRINDDPAIRVVVLTANTTGQPRPVFCSGYDIGGFDGEDQDTRLFEQTVQALAALRPVVVGALNGSVYGGATDMALACDLRVGLSGSEFRMPAAALGLHYYPSGLRRYVANFGVNAARLAFLTARPMSAQTLLDAGVLHEVRDSDQFLATVAALVADVSRLAPLAAQATKRSLSEIAHGLYDEERLLQRQSTTLKSEDFLEGRNAFTERRKPVFQGR